MPGSMAALDSEVELGDKTEMEQEAGLGINIALRKIRYGIERRLMDVKKEPFNCRSGAEGRAGGGARPPL